MTDWNLADWEKKDCKLLKYMDIGCDTYISRTTVPTMSWERDDAMQVAAINAEKMNIRRHATVANGQCSHVEMEYTALLYFYIH